MKKSVLLILFLLSFNIFCVGQEFKDIKISSPRMNGEKIEVIQIALNKCGLLPEKEIDGWYGPITEKALKKLQKIIDYEETGVIDYDLYSLLINPDFQAVVLSEIMNDNKFQKEEFDIVLDLSGYEICVYRNEKNNIYKYKKSYWTDYGSTHEREIQFIEEYYFINKSVHKKTIENPALNDKTTEWTFNIKEDIHKEIQNLYTRQFKWEIDKNLETNRYEVYLLDLRNNQSYKIGNYLSLDDELVFSKNTHVRSKRNSISTVYTTDHKTYEDGFIIFRENNYLNIYFYSMGNNMESVLKEMQSIPLTDRDIVEVIE